MAAAWLSEPAIVGFNSDEELLIPNGNNSHNVDVLLDNHVSTQRVPRRKRITYEDAIRHAGFGRFHYKLLALCGFALLGNTMQILNVSLVLPLATCEFHLTEIQRTWFSNILYFGVLVGGVLFAGLADWNGRRQVLVLCLGAGSLFSFASSLAQDFAQFAAFRFISGIGIGGSIPVLFAYCAEFQPKSCRGKILSVLSTFWAIGSVAVSGLAWVMVPYKFGVDTDQFHYNSWHIFLSLCIMPSLVSALLFFLMPESPLHLMESGQDSAAYDVFQGIFEENHRHSLPSEFELLVNRLYWSIDHMNSVGESVRISSKQDDLCRSIIAYLRSFVELFRSWPRLFGSLLVRRFLTIFSIVVFVSFGYYGYFTWLQELFERFKEVDKNDEDICMRRNHTKDSGSSEPCYPSDNFYRNNIIVAVFNLPGCLLGICLIDRVGRRFLLAISMVLSGAVVFSVWLVHCRLHAVFMSSVFSCLSIVGWNTLNVLAVEMFPTSLRCTAFGLLTGIGAVASYCGVVAFGQFVLASCTVPAISIAVLLAVGGLFALLLPNSCRTDLT